MIDLQFTTGGFPMTNDRLETVQKAYQELRAILSLMGDKIIVTGKDGTQYGIVGNGMYRIVAGTGSMYKRTEIKTAVTYADGEEKTFSVETVLQPGTVGEYDVADFVTVSTPLSSLGPAVLSNSSSIGTIETRLSVIEGILNGLGEDIGGAINAAASVALPVGSIIMFGKSIKWDCKTLNEIKTQSGIPYGYMPAGDIWVTKGPKEQAVEAAWNAYLAEIGVTQKLSGYTNTGKLIFSVCHSLNLSNRFPMGADNMTTPFGQIGGKDNVTLATSNLPSHKHSLGTSSKPMYGGGLHRVKGGGEGNIQAWDGYSKITETGSTGSGSSFSVLNPYCAVYYLIKMK